MVMAYYKEAEGGRMIAATIPDQLQVGDVIAVKTLRTNQRQTIVGLGDKTVVVRDKNGWTRTLLLYNPIVLSNHSTQTPFNDTRLARCPCEACRNIAEQKDVA